MSNWRTMAAGILNADPASVPGPASATGPSEIEAALIALRQMKRPSIATSARWSQITCDAEALVGGWGERLTQLGWSVPDLFGFDLAGDNWRFGLVFALRGGTVVLLSERSATILEPDGVAHRLHYRRDGQPAPVWMKGTAR